MFEIMLKEAVGFCLVLLLPICWGFL
ncbi:unnamed protein product [Spirodela intermedia]|uniref:Uncharacterized protein n=1 Tax=Spirodela intermedia TaxID=51605 RepID=A0A7I8J6W1_SPIIN|nr:unnamed protein product [Spirodela intermedia]CAA6665133.1 unnamed protein product [Spirodela intermedia]